MYAVSRKVKKVLLSLLAVLMLSLATGASGAAPDDRRVRDSAAAVVAQASEARRVHVFLTVYGPDIAFGRACRNDVKAFRSVLERGFETKKDRLVFHDYTGMHPETHKPWTADQVMSSLRNLRLGANESVVFFHSGHGHIEDRARPEETQEMTLTGTGRLVRGQVLSVLRAQQPRALIMLTDCCSCVAQISGQDHGRDAAARVLNAQTVQALFLRATGQISLTAAEVGSAALVGYDGANPGEAGSAFTVAMLRLFYAKDKTYSTWGELFPVLREETYAASSIPGRTPHRAHAFTIQEGTAVAANVVNPTNR